MPRRWCRLLKGIPAKINLIPFNPWPGSPYECSDWDQIEKFSEIVFNAGYASPVRTPRGRDILAACGQLKSATEKLQRPRAAGAARDGDDGLMALIGRIFVIFFAFLIASFVAAMVMASGMLLPYDWQNLTSARHPGRHVYDGGRRWLLFHRAAGVASRGRHRRARRDLSPALGLVLCLRRRVRGLAAVLPARICRRHCHNDPLMIRMAEIMAAAGIVAGLCYWAMTGRNAGKWRERPRAV